MKNFTKYICLFLAIVGINVNTWAAASVIFPAGSETVNYQDWTTAGAPSSYTNGNYNFTIDAVSYTMHLTNAAEYYYNETSNYLQLRKADGNLSMRILSKNGCKVTICYARDVTEGSFTMSLGGSDETLNPTTEYATKMMQTSKKDATLEIATNNSCVAYIKYIKVEALSRGDISAIAAPEAIVSEVSYDGNGVSLQTGEGQAYEAFPYAQGQSVTTAATPVWTGYTFNGWKRSDNADIVAAGANFTMPGTDVTLTAQWAVQAYDVTVASVDNATIVANEQAEGSVTSTEYGATVTLDVATDPGYSFDHWNVIKTIGGATVTVTNNQFTMPDAAVTVSAVITKDPVYANYQTYCPRTVEFDKNGQEAATNWPATIVNAKRGSLVTEPEAPSVAGASFIGWFKETTCDNAWDFETDVVGTGDVTTLYAKWEVAKVNVTYHHAGEDHVEPVDYNANPVGFTPDACSDENRVFVGWSESEVAEAVQSAPATVDPTEATITAEKHFYAVYASRNGGKVTGTRQITENFNDVDFTSPTLNWESRTYTNQGITWNISHGSQATPWGSESDKCLRMVTNVTGSSITVSSIMDLQTVVFNVGRNAGKASGYDVTGSITEVIKNTEKTFVFGNTNTKRSNSFDVNATAENATIKFTVDKISDSKYIYIDDVVFTIAERSYYLTDYATSCEKAASTTLTYDADGGTAQTAVTEAGWVTLPTAGECERGCYTLTGWTCSGDGLTYEPGARYLFNHDVTMTAQWSVNLSAPVTVTYHTGLEGATTETVADVHCGDKLNTKLPVPDPCDAYKFTFEGWTTNGSYAESTTAPEIIDLNTYVVNGDVALYAVWSHGKNIFTKQTAESPFDVGDQIIIVEPTHQQALSASLACAEAPETSTNIIETDERYIVWTLSDAGDGKFNLKGINGNLHIAGNTTRALELLDDANYASAEYKGFTITKSSSYYAITQSVAADKTRRVNYNKKKGIWNTYASNTAGFIYKKTGATSKTYTLDGVCERVYHATEAPVLITSVGQPLSAEGIVVVENPDANTPVAVRTSGSGNFTVTVSNENVTTNGDGSKNYTYKVTYTPADANQTETATFSFQHSAGGGEAHTTPDAVTFTGHSLPTQFVIATKVDEQYYMLPGNSAMGTPNAIEIEVENGKAMNIAPEHVYRAQTVTARDYQDIALSLNTTSGLLWQSQGSGTETNIANNGSAGGTRYGLNYFSWTFASDDDYVTYTLSNQTDDERNLAMNTSTKKFGYYNVTSAHTDALYILPLGNIIITEDNTDFAGFDVADLSNMDVIVCPNATLTLTQNVTVKNLIFQKDEEDNVGAVYVNGTLTATNVYLDMLITSANWHTVSLPSAVSTSAVMVDGTAGKFRGTNGWLMRAFDGQAYSDATNVKGWYNVTTETDASLATSIPANKAVLVGLAHENESETHTLRFPITLASQRMDAEVAVDEFTGAAQAQFHGWNFVGMPYASRYQADAISEITMVSVPIAAGYKAYEQHELSDIVLKPFSAYFFQVAETGNLTFETGSRVGTVVPAPVAARASQTEEDALQRVGLILTNAAGEQDETGLRLKDDYNANYELGHDLVKMFGSSYQNYSLPVVYTRSQAGQMAINALPYSATDMIPVGYYAAAQGTYTFSLNENRDMSALEGVYLTDTQTGAVTNLLYSSYEFTSARQATNDSRFYLTVVRAAKVPTDIETIGGEGGNSGNNGTEVIKIMYDNKLFIIRGGHVYDATGKQVK